MTMAEIEYRTPNGLHDAYLLGFAVDNGDATLRLEIDWLVETLDSEAQSQRPGWKRGTLLIEGLQYFVIGPPRNGLTKFDDYSPDQVHGSKTSNEEIKVNGLPDVTDDAFRHTLYLGYWEPFIHFAGTSATVSPADLIVREMSAG